MSNIVLSAKSSAPGKAIIFGEHAVVHGVTAIAAALSDLRIIVSIDVVEGHSDLHVTFQDIHDGDNGPVDTRVSIARVRELIPLTIPSPLSAVTPDATIQQELLQQFSALPFAASQCMMAISYLFFGIVGSAWDAFVNSRHLGLKIHVQSAGIPIGAGLGSSAAFSVATVGAFLQLFFKITEPAQEWGQDRINLSVLETINAWAFVGEILIHGTPSGLDNTTSCYGGMVKFKRVDGGSKFENLKHVPSLNMLLINTKVPRSTKALVAGVKVLYESFPTVVSPIFASIDAITVDFLELAEKLRNNEIDAEAARKRIETLIRVNQSLLDAIGVGHPALTSVVEISAAGGYSGKLTGAGGGGCALTLIEDDVEEGNEPDALKTVISNLRAKGFDVFRTSIGGDGVRWL